MRKLHQLTGIVLGAFFRASAHELEGNERRSITPNDAVAGTSCIFCLSKFHFLPLYCLPFGLHLHFSRDALGPL